MRVKKEAALASFEIKILIREGLKDFLKNK